MESDSSYSSYSSFSSYSDSSYGSYGSYGSYSFSDSSSYSPSFSFSFDSSSLGSYGSSSSSSSSLLSSSFDSSILSAYSDLSSSLPNLSVFDDPAPALSSPLLTSYDVDPVDVPQFDMSTLFPTPAVEPIALPVLPAVSVPAVQSDWDWTPEAVPAVAVPVVDTPAIDVAPSVAPVVETPVALEAPAIVPVETVPVAAEPAVVPAPVVDDWMDYGVGQMPLETVAESAPPVVAEPAPQPEQVAVQDVPAAPVDEPAASEQPQSAVDLAPSADDWMDYGVGMVVPVSAPLAAPATEPSDEEQPTEAVATPVPPPGEIEVRPLEPLPPEKQTRVVQRGDTITKLVGNDVAAIGDFAVRNGLRNSTIVAGREYDTTPMDRANMSAEDISLREKIGQAFLNQDNARLSALAEAAKQRQIAAQQEADRRAAQSSIPDVPFGSGVAAPGSFMAGAQVQPSIFNAPAPPALPRNFLTNTASNPLAELAHAPGVVLGRSAFNIAGYDANMPSTVRSAGETGFTPGVTTYQTGDVSLLGINNYSVTSLNQAALGGSLTLRATEGAGGLAGSVIANGKAQSLLTDTMFETLPNGVGYPGETMRVELAGKVLMQSMPIMEVKTDGLYGGMEKHTVTAALGSFTAGLGGSVEVQNPFSASRKIGFEGSAIVDLNLLESKQMSAMGSVADPANGIYGASFGFETRNRLASGSLTLNGGADIGIIRGKLSGQAFVSAGAFGGGGTASWAWNDNEGSLTLQGTASVLAGIGGGLDLSGKVQADWAKGLVKDYIVPVGNWIQKGSAYVHGALTGVSIVPGPVGAIAGAADAGLYYVEGNKVEAGISGISAVAGIVSSAGGVKLGLKTGQAVMDATKLAKLEASAGPDAVKAATEIFETFDLANTRKGLTIGNRTALVDGQSNFSMLLINDVTEAEVVAKFLEITGTKSLPAAARLETKTGVGVRYTVETEAGNFTLRNASTSPMPGGNGGWTLDVPSFLNARAPNKRTEIKFPTPQTPPTKP